jgi:hypothetical protein
MSLGACAPCLGEEIYTIEHQVHGGGKGHQGRGRGKHAKTWMVRSPEGGPVSRGSLKKKNMQPKVGSEGQKSCSIYTQRYKHTQSIFYVLQSGVCMSACLSISMGAGYQEPCPSTPHCYLPAPPWKEIRMDTVPKLGGLVGASR